MQAALRYVSDNKSFWISVLNVIPTVPNHSFKFLGELQGQKDYFALKKYIELFANNTYNKTIYFCTDSIITKLG